MIERDGRIVRRALVAGAAVGAVLGAVFGVGLAGAGGQASAAGVLLGLSVGGFVCSAWLLLALGLDLAARERPGRQRLLWTGAVTGAALLLPLLALAAGGAGGAAAGG